MRKVLFVFLLSSAAYALNSPFSRVRVTAYDADGSPSEEVHDLTICMEKNPTEAEKDIYEDILGYYADGLYEATNGANFIGNIIIYPENRFCSSTDIKWKITNVWPGAGTDGIGVSDDWGAGKSIADDQSRLDFGITLTHETMHYRYAIDDDYAKTLLEPTNYAFPLEITADPVTDWITIKDKGNLLNYPLYFKKHMSVFSQGTPVVFVPIKGNNGVVGRIPQGLSSTALGGTGLMVNDFAMIDQVNASQLDFGIYSFNLKDASGRRIDIRDEGVFPWGMDLPGINRVSVAHSLMYYQYDVAASKACGDDNIQWQWANLSTSFNINPYSPMAMCCEDSKGLSSAWDLLTRDPQYDFVYGADPGENYRRWYKSLNKKKPTESDVFIAKSFLMNYNPDNGKVLDGYASWVRNDTCEVAKTYVLPYMKVELAGRSPQEYRKETRKYLNIQWVDKTSVEMVILLDCSGSMNVNGKMDEAKLAAKFIAQSFLSLDAEYDVSNISITIYAFNEKLIKVYEKKGNPSIREITDKINSIVPAGKTVLYDALYKVINDFAIDNPASLKLMYVVSDGLNNGGEKTLDDVTQLYRSKNISIYSFAYGDDADLNVLSDMAVETGGVYYEKEQGIKLKVVDAVAALLGSFPGNEQLKSLSMHPHEESSEFVVPLKARLVKVYGSYDGESSERPVNFLSKSGLILNSTFWEEKIGNTNFFVAEIDSAELSSLGISGMSIKNELNRDVNLRVIASNEYHDYSLNVSFNKTGPFSWPSKRTVMASVQGIDGLLADVDAVGKLVDPDGNVVAFDLHDDGKNGDRIAGDGLYFADMPQVRKNGVYQWEIQLANKRKKAHTTRIGRTLPDTVSFDEYNVAFPFELIKNGQFIVSGCCEDEPQENLKRIFPEKSVEAFLQSGEDIDQFEIAGTMLGKSYSLRLSSRNLDLFEKVEIYSPLNKTSPIYAVDIDPVVGLNYVLLPLAAEFSLPGYIVSVVGKGGYGTEYSLLLLEKNNGEFAVGRFESDSDWHSEYTFISLDTKRKKEGRKSLVTPAGWKIIESRSISTTDFELVGNKMGLDIFVPITTQNPYWIGNVEIWVSVPSINKRIQLGSGQQIQSYLGGWSTYEFSVPNSVKQILEESHSDVQFQILLNTADSLWIDNLRFSGDVSENPIKNWSPECPDDEGCEALKPLVLHVNESKSVEADNDVWIEIVGFPENWTPAMLSLGVSAVDGLALSGYVAFEGRNFPLRDWYSEVSFDFDRGKRFLLRFSNMSGRNFRVNAWLTGQVMDVAKTDSRPNDSYVLNFW